MFRMFAFSYCFDKISGSVSERNSGIVVAYSGSQGIASVWFTETS